MRVVNLGVLWRRRNQDQGQVLGFDEEVVGVCDDGEVSSGEICDNCEGILLFGGSFI